VGEIKAAEAITQHLIAEGALGTDPALETRGGEFGLELLKTGQAEEEAVKYGAKNGRRRNVGVLASIGEGVGSGAKIEDFIQVTGEGREFVLWSTLPFS
jgi:uncharacterized Ntn-hydrolase superfamily protein